MQSITNVKVSSVEVATIMDSIIGSTQAHNDDALVIGCIATALTVCNPGITKDKLLEGVKHVSEIMALWVATNDEVMRVN